MPYGSIHVNIFTLIFYMKHRTIRVEQTIALIKAQNPNHHTNQTLFGSVISAYEI